MTVAIEKKGPVMTVVIARPHAKNAVDGPTAEALAQALREFDTDPDVSVAVLAGAGGTFCAGADLKAFGTALAGSANPLHDDMARTAPMGPSRLLLSKPVIAAVDGYAVAGGMELALWCDLRVMEESAVFGIFCRRWGVPLIDGGTVRLPRLIGTSRALDLILTGRPVHAQEALAMGLANRIVPDGEARVQAQALAAEIARFPQMCLRNDRASVYEQDGLSLEAALVNEFRHGRATLASGEAQAGAARFTQGAGRGGSFER
jgi:enoyl-CoA hydratase